MSKITLAKPLSGYNLAAINDNFTLIEQEFQNKALYRNNTSGEANQLEVDIDANSKRILNLPAPLQNTEAARLKDVQNAIQGVATANLISYTGPNSEDTNVQALADSTGASLVGYLPSNAGAAATTVQAKLRESVSVLDFGAVGDGVANDTTAVQAAIATGKDVDFLDLTCKITSQLVLNSNQTLFASNGGGVAADVADYAIKAIGSTGAAISSVTVAIVALTWTITMASPVGLTAGDQILLYDVVTDEYEVNRVQLIISNTVYTTWPITQNFATPANVRLYKLTPIENAKIRDLTVRNINAGGGGVRFIYTKDSEVLGCDFDDVGYISCSVEASVGGKIHRNKFSKSGATAAGLRVTKSCSITENHFVDTLVDEAISLFKSNSHACISGNTIAQYLSGGGGTAGNSILLDQHNYYNTITGNTLNGSATYHVYLFSDCSYNTIVGNTLVRANLGSIKVDLNSNGNTIDNNVCTGIVDATDPFEGGAATAAIRVKSNCSGNIIGPGNTFAALAGLQIVDQQTISGNVQQQLKGPTFSAYQSAAQALGSGVTTKLLFQTEEFDTDAAYDTATSKFQPTVAGYYQLNANVAAATVASAINCRILKNGASWKSGGNGSGAYQYSNGVSTIVYLNGSTDYAEVAGLFSVGQNTEALASSTWFNGAFLRS